VEEDRVTQAFFRREMSKAVHDQMLLAIADKRNEETLERKLNKQSMSSSKWN